MPRTYNRSYSLIELGRVEDHLVVDVPGSRSQDQTPHDYLERVALSIPAPGPSLVPSSSQAPRERVQIQNCQTWLREVVESLVQKNVIGEEALQTLENAPKN
ncbi:hypothetical protein M501DRAFT_989447 [Patellaria atrata CBS 101060]|uniref:Uncharacterized protein n=1 Tax=Patellaria atrata CBS 101060 TaxID=1346257 RepID=A0A9P4S2C1_9PEZI|nr:hypothetical protein M501DRAFT_989447 [Patellaria atrata CBS 101060]